MRFTYIILGLLVLLVLLAALFPDVANSDHSLMRILYLCVLMLLVGSGITLQRSSRRENIRNAAIWIAIIAGLALAYELLAKISG